MSETPTALRHWTPRLLVLLAIGAVAAGLRFTVLAPDPLLVQVAVADRGPVEATVTNSKAGTLRTRLRSRMSAETGGRVIRILHREGDRVERGALLIQLNEEPHVAQVELVTASLRAAVARNHEACLNRDLAGREAQRGRELAKSNVVSADQIDRLDVTHSAAKLACDASSAEVERSQASLRAAEAELEKVYIRAPFAGVVAEINTEVGEWVTPSPPLLTSPAVVDILAPESIYVSAPMDEVDSSRIREDQPVKITVDSQPGQIFAGQVARVAPYVLDIEAQNRTVEVEVEFTGETIPDSLLAGTSADIEVILEQRGDVIRIPTSALLEGGRVLVLRDGVLEEVELEIGLRNWDFAEVISGLVEGERVVTSLDRKEVEAGAKARVASEAGGGAGLGS
jgi:HlyD family secretion protein